MKKDKFDYIQEGREDYIQEKAGPIQREDTWVSDKNLAELRLYIRTRVKEKFTIFEILNISRIIAKLNEIPVQESKTIFEEAVKKIEHWFENRKSHGDLTGATIHTFDVSDYELEHEDINSYTLEYTAISLEPDNEEALLEFLATNPEAQPIFDNEIRELVFSPIDEDYRETHIYFGNELVYWCKRTSMGDNIPSVIEYKLFGKKVAYNDGFRFFRRLKKLIKTHSDFQLDNSMPEEMEARRKEIQLENWLKIAKHVEPGKVTPGDIKFSDAGEDGNGIFVYDLCKLIQGNRVRLDLVQNDLTQEDEDSYYKSFHITNNMVVIIEVVGWSLQKEYKVYLCIDSETNNQIIFSLTHGAVDNRLIENVKNGDADAKKVFIREIARRNNKHKAKLLENLS